MASASLWEESTPGKPLPPSWLHSGLYPHEKTGGPEKDLPALHLVGTASPTPFDKREHRLRVMGNVSLGGKSWVKPRVPAAHIMTLGHTLHFCPSPLGSPCGGRPAASWGSWLPRNPSPFLSPHLAFFQDWPGPYTSLTHPPRATDSLPRSLCPRVGGPRGHPCPWALRMSRS